MKKTLPDAVNPLLVGQNLRERLDEGLIDRQSFKSAMAELKQKARLWLPRLHFYPALMCSPIASRNIGTSAHFVVWCVSHTLD